MPKLFRYYITCLFSGGILGTDEEAVAIGYAQTEDAFVVDTQNGMQMIASQNEAGWGYSPVKQENMEL
jgi:hypothetical protein